jgi:uncharacterized protein YndB with AHSA1/START domain
MINVSISTIIYRPVKQVFDFVSKPENDFLWQYGTLETARLSEGVNNSGSFFRSIGHLMGHRNLSTFEVTEYDRNKKYSFKSLSGPLHSRTSYTFEAVNGGTKTNVSMQASLADSYQMNEGLMEKSSRKQLKENLALLKGLLEAGHILLAPETNAFTNENML